MSRIPRSLWRVLAVSWAAVIFFLSTKGFGSATSRSRLAQLLHFFGIDLPGASIRFVNLMVRKSAHIIEFGILGFLLYKSLADPGEQQQFQTQPALRAIILTACYAFLDELHQAIVPGRGASVTDFAIDLTGALIAITLVQVMASKGRTDSGSKNPTKETL